MIKLVVGLGNPGPQYDKTRHNAGFIFLDRLVAEWACEWSLNKQFQGEVAQCFIGGVKLVMLKPVTFMNKSGLSVVKFLHYYGYEPEEMLVVHDELELPEGAVRLKFGGGHAGHNGLRDIIAHVSSKDFYRLRFGIGRPVHGNDVANYVLSSPSREGCVLLEQARGLMVNHFDWLIQGKLAEINELAAN